MESGSPDKAKPLVKEGEEVRKFEEQPRSRAATGEMSFTDSRKGAHWTRRKQK
jgi:hypothetical protein